MKNPSLCALAILMAALFTIPARAEDEFGPIESRLVDRAVVMKLPDGVRRIRLRVKQDDETWKTCTIAHLEGSEGYLKLRLPDGVEPEDLEVTASWTDPFPYSFYQGRTDHAATETSGSMTLSPTAGPQAMEDGFGTRDAEPVVEESDIWKWRDRTLYFFNQYRGLQVIDVSDPAAPDRLASLRIDSYGEQMYLHPEDDSVILLTYDSSSGNGKVLVVAHESTHVLQQRASIPVPGYILESRLVGNILYVVSRHSWQQDGSDADGTVHLSWRSGLAVTKLDLSDPANPLASPPLELTSDQYNYWGAQVQATSKALLVSTNAYDSTRQQSVSTLHVIDISDPAAPPALTHHLPVAGHVLNKFNLNLDGDILTVVSQVWRGFSTRQRYASVETFDLSRTNPKLAGIEFANNESITASRFVGDLLYVVTFLLIDPLFVIDLADPTRPKLLGELEIPGFSTYLQPHGDEALLSIGVEDSQIAVSWFDVSDPADPSLASRVYIGADDGWSWSEANWDEKALGYFPEDGLLLVPYQGSVPGAGWTSGVQLVEIGDRELTKRGSFAHEFSARRARVLGDAVVSISGRSLKSLDVSDRDHPRLLAELALAWPADLVHRVGDLLVQLEHGSGYSWSWSGTPDDPARLHVGPADDPDELLASLELPAGRIAGSFRQDHCLFIAQVRTTSTQIEDRVESSETFTTTVVDLGDPDRPVIIGQVWNTSSTTTGWYGYGSDLEAALLPDGTLVWYPAEQSYHFFWDIMPFSPLQPVRGGLSYPSFPSSSRVYTVDISDKTQPEILAAVNLATEDGAWPEGQIRLVGATLFHGLQKTEARTQSDGATKWFAQHWLGHLDLSDPAQPARGELVELPGTFEHALGSATGGATLFTTNSAYFSNPDGNYRYQLHVEALAFDGLQAFLIDDLIVPDWSYGPKLFDDRYLILADSVYSSTGATAELTIHEWLASGSFREGPTLKRPDSAHRLGIRENLLIVQGAGLTFLDFADPSDPDPAAASFANVNFWQRPALIELHERKAAHLPLGLHGVQTLDFEGAFDASTPVPSPSRGQDPQAEWQTVPLELLTTTNSGRTLLLGALATGQDWRFDSQIEQLDYQAWMTLALGLAPGDPVPDHHADFDFDGQTNLWEFYTGTDPADPRDVAPLELFVTTGPDGLRYLNAYLPLNPHAAAAVRARPLVSDDLMNWDHPADWTVVSDPFQPGFGFRLNTPVQDAPAAFLKVELAPAAP